MSGQAANTVRDRSIIEGEWPRGVQPAATHPSVQLPSADRDDRPAGGYENIRGRLVEISADRRSANLTLAVEMIVEAQTRGETCAWVMSRRGLFFPPDAAENGVDLDALAIIRCPNGPAMIRAADTLGRSGAFGLVVIDTGAEDPLTLSTLSRLAGLAQKHACAFAFLTRKRAADPSLGSLVSLRLETDWRRAPGGGFLCATTALKDKRRGPGRRFEERRHGPPGVC